MTTVLLELAPDDREVTKAGKRAYADREQVIVTKLMQDGFPPDRAERLAGLCTSAIQGALVESRVQRSDRPLRLAAEELGNLLAMQSHGAKS